VALGYSQISGVYYTKNFAPVVNVVSFRLQLLIKEIHDYKAKVVNIETALSEGDMDTELYMNYQKDGKL
jgi:hypothetical protein